MSILKKCCHCEPVMAKQFSSSFSGLLHYVRNDWGKDILFVILNLIQDRTGVYPCDSSPSAQNDWGKYILFVVLNECEGPQCRSSLLFFALLRMTNKPSPCPQIVNFCNNLLLNVKVFAKCAVNMIKYY